LSVKCKLQRRSEAVRLAAGVDNNVPEGIGLSHAAAMSPGRRGYDG